MFDGLLLPFNSSKKGDFGTKSPVKVIIINNISYYSHYLLKFSSIFGKSS